MHVEGRRAQRYDGAERLFSVTTLKSIGLTVVGVLRHPEETKSRAVCVQDTAVTQKGLLDMAKRAGGEEGWVCGGGGYPGDGKEGMGRAEEGREAWSCELFLSIHERCELGEGI